MAKPSAYAKKIQAQKQVAVDINRKAERETVAQFLTDMILLTLNDPEIMGHKNTFGKKRLERVIDGWQKKCATYRIAITDSVEADYYLAKMDAALKEIFGDDLEPLSERYPWLSRDATR